MVKSHVTARDPFNSMPCEEPDDPCFCTGPKSQAKQKMICRNTDQYCLHVPKGEHAYVNLLLVIINMSISASL